MTRPEQLRAARALLGLSQRDVAGMTGRTEMTIRRAETGGKVAVAADTVASIRETLETCGVEFIDENGGGAGVRLSKGRGIADG